jgi:hypothetical protein
MVEIHVDTANGPLLAKIKIDKTLDWKVVRSKVSKVPAGVHDLVITQKKSNPVELDWLSFE